MKSFFAKYHAVQPNPGDYEVFHTQGGGIVYVGPKAAAEARYDTIKKTTGPFDNLSVCPAQRRYLIGGVTESSSSRYQTREMAQQYLDQTIEINGPHCVGTIEESGLPPEIFIHCGTVAQAVGFLCPGCKKRLTGADAVSRSQI